jgi:alpha-beta hydrolase superfamily lysophospholipase
MDSSESELSRLYSSQWNRAKSSKRSVPDSMQSFLGAFPRLADQQEIRKVREDLPVYIFSGSEDPVGQGLEGVRVLIDRYRSAGLASIAHDFYSDGRHEMLHEVNRRDVITNLLVWLSGILKKSS